MFSLKRKFTLIEIIVVIAIIGLLVLIFLPKFSDALDMADDLGYKVDQKAVERVVYSSIIEEGQLPTLTLFSSELDTDYTITDTTADDGVLVLANAETGDSYTFTFVDSSDAIVADGVVPDKIVITLPDTTTKTFTINTAKTNFNIE